MWQSTKADKAFSAAEPSDNRELWMRKDELQSPALLYQRARQWKGNGGRSKKLTTVEQTVDEKQARKCGVTTSAYTLHSRGTNWSSKRTAMALKTWVSIKKILIRLWISIEEARRSGCSTRCIQVPEEKGIDIKENVQGWTVLIKTDFVLGKTCWSFSSSYCLCVRKYRQHTAGKQ